MAYCTKCGATTEDTAAFCPTCGASTGAAPVASTSAPTAARGGKVLIFVAIGIVLVAALGVGGFFLKGYLDEQARTKRATAQAEAVADFIEGAYLSYDARLLASSISRDYADSAEEILQGSSDEGTRVTRDWDRDALVMEANDEGLTLSLTSDGDAESAEVTIDVEGEGDSQTLYATVELEGSRWIVVEFDGTTVAEMMGDTSSSSGSSDDSESVCQANQRTIEGAVQQYLAASEANGIGDLVGDVDEGSILVGEYILTTPRCPSDTSLAYYIYDDGTTECPSGVHEHF